jgi:hypothetical protein
VGGWLTPRPGGFTLGKETRYPLCRRLGGRQGRSGRIWKISWTDHVGNEEVLLRVSEQRNILHEIRNRKTNWIGHILRRNCLLKEGLEVTIKGQIEVTRRRGRRRKKLLDDLWDMRDYSDLKEEALDRIKWRNILEEAVDLSSDGLLMMMMWLFGRAMCCSVGFCAVCVFCVYVC